MQLVQYLDFSFNYALSFSKRMQKIIQISLFGHAGINIQKGVSYFTKELSLFLKRNAIGPGHFHLAEALQNYQECPGALQRTSKDWQIIISMRKWKRD